jgi:hypothetical protein
MHEDELLIVARVAEREGWDDIGAPPGEHPPRAIDEHAAVTRFAAGLGAPPRRSVARFRYESRVRVVLILGALAVLGACWWVSPSRTALALLGAGAVCLIAARRRGRAARRGRARPAGPAFRRGAFRPW